MVKKPHFIVYGSRELFNNLPVDKEHFTFVDDALVSACIRNDARTVADLIEKGHQLTDDDRQYLAAFLRGEFKNKRGRRAYSTVRYWAQMVRAQEQLIIEHRRQHRLPEIGAHEKAIADVVALAAHEAEQLPPDELKRWGLPLDEDTLRNHLNRSRKPRKISG
jgi:hypothetical protein